VIHVIWEFRVEPGRAAEFERTYSSRGAWARLFRGAPGFRETILSRDSESDGRYVVIDVWRSRSAYERFKRSRAKEYGALDRRCERLTKKERKLGIFDVVAAP
jgi:heme-degrading monooxygenase HmoA